MRCTILLLTLAGAVIALASCYPQTTTPINERYGQILPPGTVPTPQGCVAYVTAPGDTLYSLTEKFYDDRYKMCLIQTQNKDKLKTITKADSTLEKGKIIFLPPDLNGRPVGSESLDNYWSRGGWK